MNKIYEKIIILSILSTFIFPTFAHSWNPFNSKDDDERTSKGTSCNCCIKLLSYYSFKKLSIIMIELFSMNNIPKLSII